MEKNKKNESLVYSANSKKDLFSQKNAHILIYIGLILTIAFLAFIGVNYIKYKSFTKRINKQDTELSKKQSEILSSTRLPYKEFNTKATEIINDRNKLIQDIENQKVILFYTKLHSFEISLKEKNQKFISELMNNPEYALQVSNAKLYTKIRDHYIWYPKKITSGKFPCTKIHGKLKRGRS